MDTPKQKGKIDPNPYTMKHMPRSDVDKMDAEMHKLRLSGQSPTLHEPKRKK